MPEDDEEELDFDVKDVIDPKKVNEYSRDILERIFKTDMKPVEAVILGETIRDATRKTVMERAERADGFDAEELEELIEIVRDHLGSEDEIVDLERDQVGGSGRLSDEDPDYIG